VGLGSFLFGVDDDLYVGLVCCCCVVGVSVAIDVLGFVLWFVVGVGFDLIKFNFEELEEFVGWFLNICGEVLFVVIDLVV